MYLYCTFTYISSMVRGQIQGTQWQTTSTATCNNERDHLLVGVIFGGFAYGKNLVDFILAIFCHVPLSMLRLKQNG